MDCSPPGSSVFMAGILEWVAISFIPIFKASSSRHSWTCYFVLKPHPEGIWGGSGWRVSCPLESRHTSLSLEGMSRRDAMKGSSQSHVSLTREVPARKSITLPEAPALRSWPKETPHCAFSSPPPKCSLTPSRRLDDSFVSHPEVEDCMYTESWQSWTCEITGFSLLLKILELVIAALCSLGHNKWCFTA